MTAPDLPVEGSEDWYDYATWLDEQVRTAPATYAPIVDPTQSGYDVILLSGQSNMTGADTDTDPALDTPTPRVQRFPATGFISAGIDPLETGWRVSAGTSAGQWIVGNLASNRRVLLVPVAKGSTGFTSTAPDTWDPAAGAGSLYLRAIDRANAAMAAAGPNARFAGIIWVQGEQDAGILTGAQYAAKLDALITGMRAAITGAGPTTPFVVGRMVPEWVDGGVWAIDAVHCDTPNRLPYTATSRTIRGYAKPGEIIHYTSAGQRLNGRSLAAAFATARTRSTVAGLPPTAPTLGTAASAGTTSATVQFAHIDNEMPGRTYVATSNPGGITASADANNTSPITVTGLTTGQSYTFTVTATNSAGSTTSAPSNSTTVGTTPPTHLVDSGPNARTGTIGGTTPPTIGASPFAGGFSNALAVYGTGTTASTACRVTCGATGFAPGSGFTVDARVRLAATGVAQTIVSKWGSTGLGPSNDFLLYIGADDKLLFAMSAATTAVVAVVDSAPLTAGVNYVIRAVDDGSTMSLFRDGTRVATVSHGALQAFDTTTPVVIAAQASTSPSPLTGAIDEVRLSQVARTAPSATSYTVVTSPFTSDADTLGLWHLDGLV